MSSLLRTESIAFISNICHQDVLASVRVLTIAIYFYSEINISTANRGLKLLLKDLLLTVESAEKY